MIVVLIAFGLGIVAGLRTFTAPAALLIARGSIAGWILGFLALGEYVADLLPNTPSRTQLFGLSARLISGAFSGYVAATGFGAAGWAGAVAGVLGSVVGTYGGHAGRLKLIARFGPVAAALTEDLVAIVLAVIVVTSRA